MTAMHEPTTYEVVVRGRASDRLLRSLLDEFAVDHPEPGRTRLTGLVRDPAHLHGVLAHLTSLAIEIDRVIALDRPDPKVTSPRAPTHRQEKP